jgi:hypothetical protein
MPLDKTAIRHRMHIELDERPTLKLVSGVKGFTTLYGFQIFGQVISRRHGAADAGQPARQNLLDRGSGKGLNRGLPVKAAIMLIGDYQS